MNAFTSPRTLSSSTVLEIITVYFTTEPFSEGHLLGSESYGRNLENTALQPKCISPQNLFRGTSPGFRVLWKKLRKHCLKAQEGRASRRSEVHLWKSSLYWTNSFCRKVAILVFPGTYKFALFHLFHEMGSNKSK